MNRVDLTLLLVALAAGLLLVPALLLVLARLFLS
jgi:hypothetical protein